MMSGDLVYLCGLYEERLRCLLAIIKSATYIGKTEIKLIREILDGELVSTAMIDELEMPLRAPADDDASPL